MVNLHPFELLRRQHQSCARCILLGRTSCQASSAAPPGRSSMCCSQGTLPLCYHQHMLSQQLCWPHRPQQQQPGTMRSREAACAQTYLFYSYGLGTRVLHNQRRFRHGCFALSRSSSRRSWQCLSALCVRSYCKRLDATPHPTKTKTNSTTRTLPRCTGKTKPSTTLRCVIQTLYVLSVGCWGRTLWRSTLQCL